MLSVLGISPLTLCLGVLDPIPIEIPDTPPLESYRWGNFQVHAWGHAATLTCLCGRSEKIPAALADLKKASPLHGIEACEICIKEYKSSKSRTQQVEAWIRRNRLGIDQDKHLYLPENLQRFVSEGQIMRPRRCTYQTHYGVDLASEDHVLSTCGDAACLNPYHMMIGKSPAKKITPQMQNDIDEWLNLKIKTKTIVELLQKKYHKKISVRTIQLIQKEWRQSAGTTSFCGC
jgi:hypothetical protein